MGRKRPLNFTRNSNKKALEAEKKIASFVLFYDEEELKIFFDNFLTSIKQSDFDLSKNMQIFVNGLQNVYKNMPELLNSSMKETFFVEPIIEKILDHMDTEIFSEHDKETFSKWLEEVEAMCVNTNSENSEDIQNFERFTLAEDCCYLYYWNAFLDNVDNMNNSSKSYREKLEMMKLPEIHNSIEKDRIKLSEITENTIEQSKYTTGLEELDEYVNLLPQNLVYVVARPSVGKSMFVVNLALKNALNGIKCLYISLEMSPAQTKTRIMSWIKNGELDSKELPELEKTELFKTIDENFDMINSQSSNGEIILSYIDSFFRDNPEGIAILDSVNLVKFSGEDEWASLRHISRSLKELARKREGIIVCPCQASRTADTTGLDMSTMFGSSTLEMDTDIIIGLEPAGKDPVITPLKAKLIKNRDYIRDTEIDIKIKRSTMHFYDSYSQEE